jgi:hypothetical protein
VFSLRFVVLSQVIVTVFINHTFSVSAQNSLLTDWKPNQKPIFPKIFSIARNPYFSVSIINKYFPFFRVGSFSHRFPFEVH